MASVQMGAGGGSLWLSLSSTPGQAADRSVCRGDGNSLLAGVGHRGVCERQTLLRTHQLQELEQQLRALAIRLPIRWEIGVQRSDQLCSESPGESAPRSELVPKAVLAEPRPGFCPPRLPALCGHHSRGLTVITSPTLTVAFHNSYSPRHGGNVSLRGPTATRIWLPGHRASFFYATRDGGRRGHRLAVLSRTSPGGARAQAQAHTRARARMCTHTRRGAGPGPLPHPHGKRHQYGQYLVSSGSSLPALSLETLGRKGTISNTTSRSSFSV